MKRRWELADTLIVRYNDGFFNFRPYRPKHVGELPVPTAWLSLIGFNWSFKRPGDHWILPAGKTALHAAERGELLGEFRDGSDSAGAGLGSRQTSLTTFLLILTPIVFYAGTVLGAKTEKARAKSEAVERAYVSL